LSHILKLFSFKSRKALKDRQIDRQTGCTRQMKRWQADKQTREAAGGRKIEGRQYRHEGGNTDRKAQIQIGGWQYIQEGGNKDRRAAIQTGDDNTDRRAAIQTGGWKIQKGGRQAAMQTRGQ
jgi:hypothetical protein